MRMFFQVYLNLFINVINFCIRLRVTIKFSWENEVSNLTLTNLVRNIMFSKAHSFKKKCF